MQSLAARNAWVEYLEWFVWWGNKLQTESICLDPKNNHIPLTQASQLEVFQKHPKKGVDDKFYYHYASLTTSSSNLFSPKNYRHGRGNSILPYVFTCQTSSLSSRQGNKHPRGLRGKQKKPHANGGMYIIRPSPAAPAGTCSMALSNGDHVRTQSSLCRQGFRNLQFLDTPTKKNMACWSHTFPHVIRFLMDRYG